MTLPTVDLINALDNGMVFYRLTTEDDKGCVEYKRGALVPGQDLTGLPAEIVEQCNLIWTPDIISSYYSSIRQ